MAKSGKAGGRDGTPNLIPMNRRTKEEQKKIASAGGRASGEARRRRADFKRTINNLLTVPIDDPTWAPILQSMGIDPTLESAVAMAMVLETLKGGLSGVKAADWLGKYGGQDTMTKGQKKKAEKEAEKAAAQIEYIKAKTEEAKAKTEGGEAGPDTKADDGLIDALTGTAADDWSDGDEMPAGADGEADDA